MDSRIQQIYDLLFSPVVTPHNLLENAKLDNYEYVNYTKHDKGLKVSMKCTIDHNEEVMFYYFFDEKDYLQKAIMESRDGQELIFDRNKDIHKLVSRINKNKKNSLIMEVN